MAKQLNRPAQQSRTQPTPQPAAPTNAAIAAPKQTELPAWVGIIGVLIVVAILFYPAIGPNFVNWDDDRYVTDNPLLQEDFGFANLISIFSQEVSANYNPWAIWSLAIDNHFFGMKDARMYHVHNLILHLGVTALVYWFMRLLKMQNITALLIALLFGMHTMRVESVAWVTERKDVLFGFYYMAAAITYWYYTQNTSKKWLWYAATLGLMAMACASKIQAVAFPLGMLCLDVLMNRDEDWDFKKIIQLGLEKAPMFAISLATGFIGIHFLKSTMDGGAEHGLYPLWQRLFFAPYALSSYITKFFAPFHLSACHPYPAATDTGTWNLIYASALPILALIGLLIAKFRTSRPVLFGVGFFFVNIVFLLQIVGAGQGFLAERFTYIAYLGFFFLVGYLFEYVSENLPQWKQATQYGIGAWILFLALLTFQRNGVWFSSETLWSDVLDKYEFVDVAYNNRGTFYREKGEDLQKQGKGQEADTWFKIAIENYSKVLERKPDDTNVYLNRGNVYFAQNNNPKAAVDYDRVIELCKTKKDIDDDSKSKAWGNRGAIFFRTANDKMAQNNLPDAMTDLNKGVEYITQALRLYAKYPDAHLNRGCTHSVLGNNYIALRDNDSANKEHALAKADYEAYVSLKKDNASCYNWLGLEYAYTKDWQKAIDTYNKALELNPSSNGGEYFHNRAVAKRGMNDIAGARADAQTALSKGWKQAGALLDLMK
ncbi:MAG: hypothetical protein RI894_1928 [Bacteroidota bacterium]|jgi:tetratricopeptide (TPR) repeat protein